MQQGNHRRGASGMSLRLRSGSKSNVKSAKKELASVATPTLTRFLSKLRSRNKNERMEAAQNLRKYVEKEAREMAAERFSALMNDLIKRVFDLVNSNDVDTKLGGVLIIDELIDVPYLENEIKITRFANYLRMILQQSTSTNDIPLLEHAAHTLGHLARAGGTLAEDIVQFEVKRAVEYLLTDKEVRRHTGILVLKELAVNTPSIFHAYVGILLDNIWVALRDANFQIRMLGVEALRACLLLIAKRASKMSKRYHKIFIAVQLLFKRDRGSNMEAIHGGLLVIGEMLSNTGEFMLARFKEVCETYVLKYKDSKDRLVRETVILLLPKIAKFEPEAFVRGYLRITLDHIVSTLGQSSSSQNMGTSFLALGRIALAVGKHDERELFVSRLPEIMSFVNGNLSGKAKASQTHEESYVCVAMLCKAFGAKMQAEASKILDSMFADDTLSLGMVHALVEMRTYIPDLLPDVETRVFKAISSMLEPDHNTVGGQRALTTREVHIRLALETLGRFTFIHQDLSDTLTSIVLPYLDHPKNVIRCQAAITASVLLQRPQFHRSDSGGDPGVVDVKTNRKTKHQQLARITTNAESQAMICHVLERLFTLAVGDVAPRIRQTIIESWHTDFDYFLVQRHNLVALYALLNDDVFEIRAATVSTFGRLVVGNAQVVMPLFRTIVTQLLSELQHSVDPQRREQSAKLLAQLIANSGKRTMKSYATMVLNILTPLLETDADPNVSSAVLATLGKLARIGGREMLPHLSSLLPIIIRTLDDKSIINDSIRVVALQAMGDLIQSTGYVIEPLIRYPELMPSLIKILTGGFDWSVRKEALKLLGIVGALDSFEYKMHQNAYKQHKRLAVKQSTGGANVLATPSEAEMTMVNTHSRNYYSAVSIRALMGILREPSLSQHHRQAINNVMFIVKLEPSPENSRAFIPLLIPPFLQIIRPDQGYDESLREFVFTELAEFVSIVDAELTKGSHVDDIFTVIHESWDAFGFFSPAILVLIESISAVIKNKCMPFMPGIIRKLLGVIQADRSAERKFTHSVLKTMKTLGPYLGDCFQLIVPILIPLYEDRELKTELRAYSLKVLISVCNFVDFSSHASHIIHSFARIMHREDLNLMQDFQLEIVDALSVFVFRLNQKYMLYIPTMATALKNQKVNLDTYNHLTSKVLSNRPLTSLDLASAASHSPTKGKRHMKKSSRDSLSESLRSGIRSTVMDLRFTLMAEEDDDFVDDVSVLDGKTRSVKKSGRRFKTESGLLKKAWDTSQMSTKEDWMEWHHSFCIELLKQSPSPALRTCVMLAQKYDFLARDLFNSAFASCWSELFDAYKDDLRNNLKAALSSPAMPSDLLQHLLSLAEFMEHDDRGLPLDCALLGSVAEQVHAYAKALHYKELEFQISPTTTIEALISVNNNLNQPEAAVGILKYAQKNLSRGGLDVLELQGSWYEKLQRWEDALDSYQRKQLNEPGNVDISLGRMRCFKALNDWSLLARLAARVWPQVELPVRRKIAPLACSAAWRLNEWEDLELYMENIPEGSLNGSFFRAVHAAHSQQFEVARQHIEVSRELLGEKLTGVIGESYSRSYAFVVMAQRLTELEEVLTYSIGDTQHQAEVRDMWNKRLLGCNNDVDVWERILGIRSLVVEPLEDIPIWLKFSEIARKAGRMALSYNILVELLGEDPHARKNRIPQAYDHEGLVLQSQYQYTLPVEHPRVSFAYLRHLWAIGHRHEPVARLRDLISQISPDNTNAADTKMVSVTPHTQLSTSELRELASRCYLELGTWQLETNAGSTANLSSDISDILRCFELSTQLNVNSYDVWHAWAVMNFRAVEHYKKEEPEHTSVIDSYVVASVKGFFRSITLSDSTRTSKRSISGDNLQDILRLLTLWFEHGAQKDVVSALTKGFNTVSVDTWLIVVPQIIARINTSLGPVKVMILELLCRIADHHPQALVYPLTVVKKSDDRTRSEAGEHVLNHLRKANNKLVDQALLVSKELIRVSILWNEEWREALEACYKLWFGQRDGNAMIELLKPLHENLKKGPTTLSELAFYQTYGHDLEESLKWTDRYVRTGNESDMNQAWDLYVLIFRRIDKKLNEVKGLDLPLELPFVSPWLTKASELELTVPGTYERDPYSEPVMISYFEKTLKVIESKQRPRKLRIRGTNGIEYGFLLKGHEDLRQDKRVMQLFGLVNTLLANDVETSQQNLSIRGYSVIPLSPNSGVLEWMEGTDTLHSLIKEYRDSRNVLLNIELKLVLQMAPNYESLTVIQKVEVFKNAMARTTGSDLARVLWLKSANSEAWLDRRTNYTRSLAVSSIVGYVLGLGDRHPCNVMLDRVTGKVIHIDFGDCFEVAMLRSTFPEKVPFRLTRMLVQAMEVSGIEGNFRFTCEAVMRVLREHQESVMAVLEAFVYDPLLNWSQGKLSLHNMPGEEPPQVLPDTLLDHKTDENLEVKTESQDDASDSVNSKALTVLARVNQKLKGTDFGPDQIDVAKQVDQLILEATSHENLCQCYTGWCPFW